MSGYPADQPGQQPPAGPGGSPFLPSGDRPQRPPPMQLTPEEQRVLSKCSSESFWYRSLPLGALFATATHLAIMRGILKPSPSYGSGPKVVLSSLFGYFMGKFTYADICADKFLIEVPHGQISKAIRARRGIPPIEEPENYQSNDDSAALGAPPALQYGYAPEVDDPPPSTAGGPPTNNYDELRRRNREQQQQPPGFGGYKPLIPPPPPPPPASTQTRGGHAPTPELYNPGLASRAATSSNKYGDEGFE